MSKVIKCCVLAWVLAVAGTSAQTSATAPVPLPGNPHPRYPATAAADAAIGRVEVEIAVGPDGKARSSRVIHVAPVGYGFERAVEDAVRRWVFDPARANGVAVDGTYRDVFELGKGQPVALAHWVPDGDTDISVFGDQPSIRLGRGRGWIHTRHFFSEYTLRVTYRVTKPGTKAALLVHAIQEWNRPRMGYRINLADDTRKPQPIGRIMGLNVPAQELAFHSDGARAATPAAQWEVLEVRSGGGRLETILNGVPVAAILDGRFTGLIGFEVTAGAIEIRGAEIARQDTFLGGDFTISAAPIGSKPGPKLLREMKPAYTPQAMRDKVQGVVTVEAVVDTTGAVVQPRIARSLDIDLDQTAVAAVRQWRFEPATRDGAPVAAVVSVDMRFTLR